MPELNQAQFDVRYHITDNPRFAPDPSHRPDDNSLSLRNLQQMPKGMFVTDDPEHWINGHQYMRPFVAEVHVPKGAMQPGRFSHEDFIPAEHLGQVKVPRVMPVDAYAREKYAEPGWIEESAGKAFDTNKKLPKPGEPGYRMPGYRYSGPDVRDMGDKEIQGHMKRWSGFMQGVNGWPKEEAEALAPKRWGPRRTNIPVFP